MNRPTISLCLIAKNEAHNVPRLFESIEGCYDEIIFTDTGSTDGTLDVAKEWATKISVDIKFEHFAWINDFGAARNYSFSKATKDYSMWLDLDDALDNKEKFILWRDHAMKFADYWMAPYDYALNPDGSAAISFTRERVVTTGITKWKYFIHEGLVPAGTMGDMERMPWRVKHHRSEADQKADRSRNIKIIEARKNELDSRLTFYYGKELYEAGQQQKALSVLIDVATREDLELHDRVLALQYASYSAMSEAEKRVPAHQQELLVTAIQLAYQGLQLDQTRAEFYHIIGECNLKRGMLAQALPSFAAAEHCYNANPAGGKQVAALFSFSPLYGEIPKLQKSRIYFNLGDLDKSEKEAKECIALHKSAEAQKIYEEIQRVRPLVALDGPKENTNDIVFTTPPQTAYPFDEKLYETSGCGGSETALIQMAKWLKKITGCNVKIFQQRANDEIMPSGVECIQNGKVNEYMSKNVPKAHIAWRHNIKLTNAPTYLWCHDLITGGVGAVQNFDFMLCLTEFHKNYIMGTQGVNPEKIIVTRNGIDPEKFNFERPAKNIDKIVWMSSPDRGLEQAMKVMDNLRVNRAGLELHVYYGLENLYKYGLGAMADNLKKMMSERPWVKYHGFTEQSKMYRDVADAIIWLHPCNFIETYCITALEMLALGIYPVTRRLGGLANTLADAEKNGMATLLDHGCMTEDEIKAYEFATTSAINEEKWKRVSLDPKTLSWESLAEEWIKFLPIT